MTTIDPDEPVYALGGKSKNIYLIPVKHLEGKEFEILGGLHFGEILCETWVPTNTTTTVTTTTSKIIAPYSVSRLALKSSHALKNLSGKNAKLELYSIKRDAASYLWVVSLIPKNKKNKKMQITRFDKEDGKSEYSEYFSLRENVLDMIHNQLEQLTKEKWTRQVSPIKYKGKSFLLIPNDDVTQFYKMMQPTAEEKEKLFR